MSRQPDVIRPIKLTTTLPEDIRAKLDLYLWSDLEGRIPKSAYQRFFLERIMEFFDYRSLDIGQFCDIPTSAIVRGSPTTIALLTKLLGGPPE